MSRAVRIACMIGVLIPLQLSAGGAAFSSVQSTNPPAGNRAVRDNLAIAAAWDEAFNSANLKAVMAMYADDAISMPPGFPVLSGKAAIEADYISLFENYDFLHHTTVVQLEVQGSLAVERGEYTMLVVPKDGSPAFVETGKHLVVRRQIEGTWLVVEETWNTH